jgi:hypothetical protein
MTSSPIICFGQQPCGFFPRRYLYAKIVSARRLQAQIGGQIVYFCHDSDHDWRETRTILRRPKATEPQQFNFAYENPLQKEFSPLYLKRVSREWQEQMAGLLAMYVGPELVEMFRSVSAASAADFCLEMYRRLGLLEGIRVERSSDPAFRRAAGPIDDYFVDVPYEGEVVRARPVEGVLKLHKGGGHFITLPDIPHLPEQISPTRDTRLRWMQSVIRCTHYVTGASEQQYMRVEDAPEIVYIEREAIERADEAYVPDSQPSHS